MVASAYADLLLPNKNVEMGPHTWAHTKQRAPVKYRRRAARTDRARSRVGRGDSEMEPHFIFIRVQNMVTFRVRPCSTLFLSVQNMETFASHLNIYFI